MAQRGKRSITSLMTPNVNGDAPRVTAPTTLTPRERKIFNDMVAACAPNHFRESDIPLLVSYCTATVVSRSIANKPKQFAIFEKATRLQAALATKLRLTPQTRLDPKGVHRDSAGRSNMPRPWENADRDEDEDDAV